MFATEIIHHFVAYGAWANERFVQRFSNEPDALLDRPVDGSFPSLRATLLHIRDAEHAWLCRLRGIPHAWPAEADRSIASLLTHSRRFHDHVLGLDDASLQTVHTYSDLKGNAYQQPAWQMIMHCCNHGTQHRGQVITQMRSLGLKDIPANDLVVFQRELQKRRTL